MLENNAACYGRYWESADSPSGNVKTRLKIGSKTGLLCCIRTLVHSQIITIFKFYKLNPDKCIFFFFAMNQTYVSYKNG